MIEAGKEALETAGQVEKNELVDIIYRAMAAASTPPDDNEGRPARER
jgi:hypothetical protein